MDFAMRRSLGRCACATLRFVFSEEAKECAAQNFLSGFDLRRPATETVVILAGEFLHFFRTIAVRITECNRLLSDRRTNFLQFASPSRGLEIFNP